jgi:hypothetical protein
VGSQIIWTGDLLGFPVTDGDVPGIVRRSIFPLAAGWVCCPSGWAVGLGSALILVFGTHLADRRKDHGSMGHASAR